MKLYKDSINNIYAYEEDGSQDDLIGDKILITQEEADKIYQQKALLEFNKLSYIAKRAAEYPPITDYLDAVVKNDQAQIEKYIADCQAVKAKYPKGVK